MQDQLDIKQERALVQQATLDPESFRILYGHYFPRIYAYVAYRVGKVDDTEDLVSETFLKAVEHLETFKHRGEGSFAAWLLQIAHNVVVDFYRRNTKVEEPLPLEKLLELRDDSPLLDNSILRKEQFEQLRRLISTLSPRRQEVITLKFFGGLRNRDIAAILEIDERAVASHLCRGLKDLHSKYLVVFPGEEGGPHEYKQRME